MNIFKRLLRQIGLFPSEEDRKLKALIDSSYKSLVVVGRGTIHIDPEEVRKTKEFKEVVDYHNKSLNEIDALRKKIVRDAMNGNLDGYDIDRYHKLRTQDFMPRKLHND